MALAWALAFSDAFCKSSNPTVTSTEVVDEVVEDSLETLELDELLEVEVEELELVPAGSDEEEEVPAPQEASNDPNAKTNKAFETFIWISFRGDFPELECSAKLKTSFCWDENEEPPCFDVEQSQGQCVLRIGNYRSNR